MDRSRSSTILTDPTPSSENTDCFDTPTFRKLLALVENINSTLVEQKITLDRHSDSLQALGRQNLPEIFPFLSQASEVRADEQSQSVKPWYDPAGWRAIWQSTTTKTKEQVEGLKTRMDVSLIAIFSTVLTSFQAPLAQSLAANNLRDTAWIINNSTFWQAQSSNGNSTNSTVSPSSFITNTVFSTPFTSTPTIPPISDQIAYMFYTLALVLTILNAGSCVLGRQWVERLLNMGDASTYLEKTMRHEARKKTIMRWLWPLINNTLHWSLFLSIALFLAGLLFQSWCISVTYGGFAPILFATAQTSTLFTLLAWFAIAAATIHGVVRLDSPFSGTFSRMIRRLLALPTKIQERYTAAIEKDEGEGDTVLLEKEGGLSDRSLARREAVKTYAQLLSEVQDPDLLERAVPALQLKEWIFTTDLSVLDSFSTAYTRLISSDNSPRVRAMMNEHILHFGEWLSVSWPRLKLPANEITIVKWCQLECARLVAASGELRRMILPSFGVFSSFSHGSRRLREFYQLPYKQFLIHILCTFDRGRDQDGGLKQRRLLFWSAIDECSILLEKDSPKAFSDIPRASRVSIIQSVIGCPNPAWHELPQIIKQFLKGDETQMLQDLAPFLTRLPDVEASLSSVLVFDLLEILVQGLPVDFQLPGNIDLSRILHLATRKITRETQKRGTKNSLHLIPSTIEHCLFEVAFNYFINELIRMVTPAQRSGVCVILPRSPLLAATPVLVFGFPSSWTQSYVIRMFIPDMRQKAILPLFRLSFIVHCPSKKNIEGGMSKSLLISIYSTNDVRLGRSLLYYTSLSSALHNLMHAAQNIRTSHPIALFLDP
ncbi:hypothetical protein SISNIDRAFT_532829 [Sistotremastrum niveocremeum HHB9708]|uniref:DUF6535 domain-containing protein n=1 Tax=Sistotremastrum niveocremeum HHB9708 TaxID=1314777 RepID=A0A164NSI0_9AGAM|nr:hypothetical protein SISNIDRAFT_532829 [Sistotremastrum niveocremeum HHB9708]